MSSINTKSLPNLTDKNLAPLGKAVNFSSTSRMQENITLSDAGSAQSSTDSFSSALSSGVATPVLGQPIVTPSDIALPEQTKKEEKSLIKESLFSSFLTACARLGLATKITVKNTSAAIGNQTKTVTAKVISGANNAASTTSAFTSKLATSLKNFGYSVVDYAKGLVAKSDETVTLDDGLKDETSALLPKDEQN